MAGRIRQGLEMGREALAALAVLALLLTGFAHAPPLRAAAAPGLAVAAIADWCGKPLLPGSSDRAPCPACRIAAGADLPPPPPALIVPARLLALGYDFAPSGLPPRAPRHDAWARAPPAA